MRGKLLGIKKSTILKFSWILNIILYFIIFTLSLTIIDYPNLWFYAFIGLLGLQLIIKSLLLKLDSSCYFGVILLTLSIFHVYCFYLNLTYLYPVFVILSFCFGSFFTAYFYKQNFQYFLAFSLFVISIATFLFIEKFVSIIIFLAIICIIVLSLILGLIFIKV